MTPPVTPAARLAQAYKRRIVDDLQEVFDRALAGRDFEAASDLLEVLEKWHARRSNRMSRERRLSAAGLQRAQKELDRLRINKPEPAGDRRG